MAIYNLHICRDLSEKYVLSLFPKDSEKQGWGVEKIRYGSLADLVTGLKVLRVEGQTLDELHRALEDRAPFTISEVPATSSDLRELGGLSKALD